MKWYTHAAIGANAAWVLMLGERITSSAVFFLALGAFASLLPDIDAGWAGTSGAKIHHIGYGIFRPFRGAFRHRGFFHSFLCITILFCLSIPLAFWIHPFVPVVLTLGYTSHLFIDAWNGGMQYLYPWKKDLSFIPKWMRFRVGSFGDDAFFLLGIMGIVAFVFAHWLTFQLPFSSTFSFSN